MKKHKPNSRYWQKKADNEVTKYFTGLPCKVCGTTYQTCGHHIVERSLSAALRHHPLNIIALCVKHHKFGNELAAHSKNPLAVNAYTDWLQTNHPKRYELLETYKQYRTEKVDYEQNFYEWREMNEEENKELA